MTGAAGTRRLRCMTLDIVSLRSLLLAAFLLFGIFLGYAAADRETAGGAAELRRYLDGYLAQISADSLTAGTALRTAFCFFRAPVLAFLLGFSLVGVVALPLLLTAQGFVLSFSLFTFASALGREGFPLLAALFAIRLAFVVPCTFLLGTEAWGKAHSLAALSFGGGKRVRPVVYGGAYWYRFFACCVCLLIGSVSELLFVPALLARLRDIV